MGKSTVSSDSVAQDEIRAFVERIERLEEEKQAIAGDIKEVYAEAKGNGFNTKVLRQVIRLRKQDAAERMEQEALLELYLAALGMAPAIEEEPDEAPDADVDRGDISSGRRGLRIVHSSEQGADH
jgi:uncharacterized protein (UPF0335 family)